MGWKGRPSKCGKFMGMGKKRPEFFPLIFFYPLPNFWLLSPVGSRREKGTIKKFFFFFAFSFLAFSYGVFSGAPAVQKRLHPSLFLSRRAREGFTRF